ALPQDASGIAGEDVGQVPPSVEGASGVVRGPQQEALIEQGAGAGRVLGPALDRLREGAEANAIDGDVGIESTCDGCPGTAVARDAVADVVEALDGAATDFVAGAVDAVAGLQRGDVISVAGEREGGELDLELHDLLDGPVAPERVTALDRLQGADVDLLLGTG